MAINDMAQSMWTDIVASRFELLMFAVSVIGYFVVFTSRRNQKSAKNISCKADFALEVSQVDTTEQEVDQDPNYIEQDSADVQSAIVEHLDNEELEQACDVFEMNYAEFFDMDIDEDLERRLLMSALKCGRQSLAQHLLQTSQTDFGKHVGTIQAWWRRSSAKNSESRMENMSDVLDRMAQMFNELHPFEDQDHSDDESTCALGEEGRSDDEDSNWDDSELWS